jgi:signal transduction histidine kinase
MVGSQDLIPLEKGRRFHSDAPFCDIRKHCFVPRSAHVGGSLDYRQGTAHHEMGWSFIATEGFLSRTSIMVVKRTYASSADVKAQRRSSNDSDYRPQATIDVLPNEGGSVVAVAITKGLPVFWETWWFLLGVAVASVLAGMALFRARMRRVKQQLNIRLEERLAERTKIAQELHDTLLQDFLSVSMQLHVANDHLPVDSPAKPMLTRALAMTGRIIEEGRNTVQGLRSSNWGSEELGQAFSRIQEELAITNRARLRVIVEGVARPLRPLIGDDVFLIGREALANAFHHSGASEVEVELEYAADQLKLLVRDNGCGFADEVLQPARSGHYGLAGMRERTGRIGGRLRVLSRRDAGTEIELSVPSRIAYLP